MEKETLLEISKLLEDNIKQQLRQNYPSKTYSGQLKGKGISSPRYASGELYNQTKVYWESDFEDGSPNLVVDFGSADYWEYVNYGRRPGKYPPLFAIDKWVSRKVKGARDDNGRFIKRKSLVFLIRRSIAQYGYFGIQFLDKAVNETINIIEDKLGQAAQEYIYQLYDDGKIFPRSDFNRP